MPTKSRNILSTPRLSSLNFQTRVVLIALCARAVEEEAECRRTLDFGLLLDPVRD